VVLGHWVEHLAEVADPAVELVAQAAGPVAAAGELRPVLVAGPAAVAGQPRPVVVAEPGWPEAAVVAGVVAD